MAPVMNPLKDDLNAAGHSIQNVGALDAETMQSRTGYGVAPGGNVMFNDGDGHLMGIACCSGDPSVTGLAKPEGSLALSLTGVYRKTGPADTDWAHVF